MNLLKPGALLVLLFIAALMTYSSFAYYSNETNAGHKVDLAPILMGMAQVYAVLIIAALVIIYLFDRRKKDIENSSGAIPPTTRSS